MLPALVLIVSIMLNWNQASPVFQTRPKSSLCVKNNVSCSLHDDACTMFYFPVNSTQCSNLLFKTPPKSIQEMTLGGVDLGAYRYEDRTYAQTAINLTFSNISWTDMRFRFMQSSNHGKNTCRQFRRSEYALTTIVYDCLWSDERYEGKPFTFEYEAWTKDEVEAGKVLFTVPVASVDKSKFTESLLVNLETWTNLIGNTKFVISWRPLSSETEVARYHIYKGFKIDSDARPEFLIHDVTQCSPSLCTFSTYFFHGSVRLGVQPVFENDVPGVISYTPFVHLGAEKPNFITLICLFLASIFLPFLVYFCLKAKKLLEVRMRENKEPTMLLVYSPTTTPHLHFVEALAHYLNTNCRIIAWMDEIDVPNSPSKDPFDWCTDAMNNADIICVVASPYFGRLRSSSALYRTDRLLLRLLREHYGSGSKARYCAFLPSYTSALDLPVEAVNLRKFRFPQDFNAFLHLARSRWHVPSCLLPTPAGGTAQLDELGTELAECLQTAQLDLTENSTIYLTQAKTVEIVEEFPDLMQGEQLEEAEAESSFINTSTPKKEFQSKSNKKEQQTAAELTFGEYYGNVNLLNLSGEKSDPHSPPSDITHCSVNLDHLQL